MPKIDTIIATLLMIANPTEIQKNILPNEIPIFPSTKCVEFSLSSRIADGESMAA